MKKKPIIIADQAIPFVKELFAHAAHLHFLPSDAITPNSLTSADGLFIRSVTKITSQLLANSQVKFVGSMTAGVDHLDLNWLAANHIQVATAKGANARAVAEYTLAVIAYLQAHSLLPAQFKAAIVGVGHVGSILNSLLTALDVPTMTIDPPKACADAKFNSAPMSALTQADLISINTALTTTGEFPTQHLFDATRLKTLKQHAALINTARGEVMDTAALLRCKNLTVCTDVFEHEPKINPNVLNTAVLATPHIAGYTQQAKQRATLMVCQAAADFFGLTLPSVKPTPTTKKIESSNAQTWQEVVLAHYNPSDDMTSLQKTPNLFASLRNCYQLRNEFSTSTIKAPKLPARERARLRALGFKSVIK